MIWAILFGCAVAYILYRELRLRKLFTRAADTLEHLRQDLSEAQASLRTSKQSCRSMEKEAADAKAGMRQAIAVREQTTLANVSLQNRYQALRSRVAGASVELKQALDMEP